MTKDRDDAAARWAAIGVKPKAADEKAEPGRVREAFKAGYNYRDQLYADKVLFSFNVLRNHKVVDVMVRFRSGNVFVCHWKQLPRFLFNSFKGYLRTRW